MKRKQTRKPEASSIRLLELIFPLVPFLALVPNFYIIPDINYQGLATQEFVLATSVAILLAIALAVLFRRQTPIRINRETAMLTGVLGLFLIWQAVSFLMGTRLDGRTACRRAMVLFCSAGNHGPLRALVTISGMALLLDDTRHPDSCGFPVCRVHNV